LAAQAETVDLYALSAALKRALAKYTTITYNIEVPQKRISVEFQPRLVQPTTNYPDQDNSKSDPLPKTAFPSFFPRTSDYPAKDQDSLSG